MTDSKSTHLEVGYFEDFTLRSMNYIIIKALNLKLTLYWNQIESLGITSHLPVIMVRLQNH